MIQFLVIPATIILLVSINALYVAAEFSAVASRKTRIRQMAEGGNRMAGILLPIMEDSSQLDRYVATGQIGITISSLLLGMYGQNVIAETLLGYLQGVNEVFATATAESVGIIVVLLLITALQVILGELLPKSISIQFPEQVALALAIPMRVSMLVLSPLIAFFNGSGLLILRLLGRDHQEGHSHIHSPQEIEIIVSESHEVGLLDDEEKQMLRNAFRLRDLTARQVMIHRTRVIAAPVDSTVTEIMRLSIETGKSRIPLFENDIDHIQGFVHIKDMFRLYVNDVDDLSSEIRDIVHIPEAMSVSDVWEKLEKAGQYFGIVFDEFGGTAGLVTLEDLIEEIFGELQDESDDEAALVYVGEKGLARFRWDWLVSDINEYFDLQLPEADVDTLSGLVISELGRQPQVGDSVVIDTTIVRVEAMDDKGISEVSISDPGKPKLKDASIFNLFSDERVTYDE
ncbi:MAG: hemolysin family protein [Ardenticatenaceae bacterium]|nr:hemolysin family protein [Ardenticatenaceae bacterium]